MPQPRALFPVPLDENALFEHGAAPFRLDALSYRTIKGVLGEVEWLAAANLPDCVEGHVPAHPRAIATRAHLDAIAAAIGRMINDPSLVPGLSKTGYFSVGGVEIQNGSFDPGWHHDGLAGKRYGHAGSFFLLLYFGQPEWNPGWGGAFEFAQRPLNPGWESSDFEPRSEVMRVWPQERTAVLGWNQNPRLVHRAEPLHAPVDRITLIASLDFHYR